jgi:hypothetical protein
MKKAWEENEFRDWPSKLEKLKELKTDILSNNIQEDQTSPLAHRIQKIFLVFTQ